MTQLQCYPLGLHNNSNSAVMVKARSDIVIDKKRCWVHCEQEEDMLWIQHNMLVFLAENHNQV